MKVRRVVSVGGAGIALGVGLIVAASSPSAAVTPMASGGGCSAWTGYNPGIMACISVLSGTHTVRPDGYLVTSGGSKCQANVDLVHNGSLETIGALTSCASATHIVGLSETIGSGTYSSILIVYPTGYQSSSSINERAYSPDEYGP